MFNILVLNSDKSTGINFTKSLQLAKKEYNRDYYIIGTSTDLIRSKLCNNDQTILLNQRFKSPLEVMKYIEKKLQKKINLVYETKSAERMLQINSYRERLPVFIPSAKSIRIFENKFRTYYILKKNGFPVPETRKPKNRREVKRIISEIGHPNVWIRRSAGQGGKGSFISNDADYIADIIDRDNNGWGNYIISERLPKQDLSKGWGPHLKDDLLPGEMVTWIALYDNGDLVASQTRKRLYWEHSDLTPSGVTGYSGANMTIKLDSLHDLCDKMIRSIDNKPQGAMGADFVVDSDGAPKLTEIQSSRFFTSTYPLTLLGLNFPDLYINCFRKKSIQKGIINPCKPGMIYIQRFGADSVMVDRDTLKDGI